MKRKQSSIEWLVEMTSKLGYVSADIAEQAKEMHKQEIIAAKDDGYNDAEQYYNETFVAQK